MAGGVADLAVGMTDGRQRTASASSHRSMSTLGPMALRPNGSFAETAAKKAGTTVSRADWRVLSPDTFRNPRKQRAEDGPGRD